MRVSYYGALASGRHPLELPAPGPCACLPIFNSPVSSAATTIRPSPRQAPLLRPQGKSAMAVLPPPSTSMLCVGAFIFPTAWATVGRVPLQLRPHPNVVRHAYCTASFDAQELQDGVAPALADLVTDRDAPQFMEAVPEESAERTPAEVTLELLEWDRLSSMVAGLADTRRAREFYGSGLPVWHSQEESETLHREMEGAR